MAISFTTIQSNLVRKDHLCGCCNKPLKPDPAGKTPNPLKEFIPRHNKKIPRAVVPILRNDPALAQIQRIKGHAPNCFFHEACLSRHLDKENTCPTCKSWVYIPLPFILAKGAGSTLAGAVLGAAPEVAFRILMLLAPLTPEVAEIVPEWILRLSFLSMFTAASMDLPRLTNRVGITKEVTRQLQIALLIGALASSPLAPSAYNTVGFAIGMGFMSVMPLMKVSRQGYLSSLTSLVGTAAVAAIGSYFISYFPR